VVGGDGSGNQSLQRQLRPAGGRRTRRRRPQSAVVRRSLVALVVGAMLSVTLAIPAAAGGVVHRCVPGKAGERAGEPKHVAPQGPAHWDFGRGFPHLPDAEWCFPIGGFGGIRPHYPLHHVPVIFVHGNDVDAADWYPVRDAFRAAGYSDQELWALSYDGLGGNNG